MVDGTSCSPSASMADVSSAERRDRPIGNRRVGLLGGIGSSLTETRLGWSFRARPMLRDALAATSPPATTSTKPATSTGRVRVEYESGDASDGSSGCVGGGGGGADGEGGGRGESLG